VRATKYRFLNYYPEADIGKFAAKAYLSALRKLVHRAANVRFEPKSTWFAVAAFFWCRKTRRHFRLKPDLGNETRRCAAASPKRTLLTTCSILIEWMAATRTKRPDAHAAIADAAFPRSGGRFYAALRLASWKRPFKATISADSRPTFRRVMFELTQRGLSGPMHMRLLLMQHFLAVAADFMLRCGLRRGSGRSKLQSRRIPGRPFAASCSSSHNADKAAGQKVPLNLTPTVLTTNGRR
jgi:hypothetical protein